MDALTEGVAPGAGVQNQPADESVFELVAKTGQVSPVMAADCRAALDLDAEHPSIAVLDDEIDLPAILVAQVIERRIARADGQLGAKLLGDEGVDEAAEQSAVAHHRRLDRKSVV